MYHLSRATTLEFISTTIPAAMLAKLHHMPSLMSLILIDSVMRSDIIGTVSLSTFEYQVSGDFHGRITSSHDIHRQQTTFSTLMRITSSTLEHMDVSAILVVFNDLRHMLFPRLKTVTLQDLKPLHGIGASLAQFLCSAPALQSVNLSLSHRMWNSQITVWPQELDVSTIMQQKGLRDPPLRNLRSFITQTISPDDDIVRHLPDTLEALSFWVQETNVGSTLEDFQKNMKTTFNACTFHNLQNLQLHVIGGFSPSSFRILSTMFPHLAVFRFSHEIYGAQDFSFPFVSPIQHLVFYSPYLPMIALS
jgi:hypothetical protein